jgi:hypothetical protein
MAAARTPPAATSTHASLHQQDRVVDANRLSVASAASRSPGHASASVTSYFPQQTPEAHQYSHPYRQSSPTGNSADEELVPAVVPDQHTVPTYVQNEYTSHLVAPVATRVAKFTEEWDASRRGSSIIRDVSEPTTAMQRSNSFSGSTTGAVTGEASTGLSRGNTLKKKPSLRRGGSLKRSSSRRSMKAGSVRSLALQPTPDQIEMHSAFFCPVPTSGNPTEALAGRFQGQSGSLRSRIPCLHSVLLLFLEMVD